MFAVMRGLYSPLGLSSGQGVETMTDTALTTKSDTRRLLSLGQEMITFCTGNHNCEEAVPHGREF